MQKKIITGSIKELDEKGQGVAVISTLNVIDKDGDVTLLGAFGEQVAPMVPGHQWSETPIGKARISEDGNEVLAEFNLNLKTSSGRDWYESLKFDLMHKPPKQEWSYGFGIPEGGAEQGEFEGQRVRFLKKLIVYEVSPVLVGAGISTRTLAMKRGMERMPAKIERAYARHVVKWHFKFMESRIRSRKLSRCIGRKGRRLGSLLRRLRDEQELSNEDLARAADISESTIGGILAGEINCPPLERLRGLARALDVSLSRLQSAAEADGCEFN